MTLRRAGAKCLVTAAVSAALLGCGRGPVTPPPIIPFVPTIQFQLYVNGQIAPSQGNYLVVVNANINPSTNVNAVTGEVPGQPTAQEAQGSNPPYTHWDQEIVYGTSSAITVNGFIYDYK
ncbi:MAG: hypothetical protein M3Z41_05210, partial [Candidatus Eremiobacteraeota bacterium]|nr:hypothetical protein [Candidatus Eremiobacteraeota bacterium]